MPDVSYRFLVEVRTDSTILVHPVIPTDLPEAEREATAVDIVATSLKLAHDIDQQLMIDRITQSVVSSLVPAPEPTAPEVIREALKERGITPEQSEEDPVD